MTTNICTRCHAVRAMPTADYCADCYTEWVEGLASKPWAKKMLAAIFGEGGPSNVRSRNGIPE